MSPWAHGPLGPERKNNFCWRELKSPWAFSLAATNLAWPGPTRALRSLEKADEAEVRALFNSIEPNSYDALIITALGRAVHGSFLSLDVEKARELFEGKFLTLREAAEAYLSIFISIFYNFYKNPKTSIFDHFPAFKNPRPL